MKEEDSSDEEDFNQIREYNTNNNINPVQEIKEENLLKDLSGKNIEENNLEEKNKKENQKKELKLSQLSNEYESTPNLKQSLLNKSDFVNQSFPAKKNFCETRYIKRIILIIIYIGSYVINAIYVRINSLNLIPIKASFIQGALLTIFIPISFFVSSNRNFKRNRKYIGREKEVLNIEIEKNMKENLSDFMNKKYYEVYYHYVSKFYVLTGFFSVFYFLSIYFFYQGISYTQPLFGQLFFPFISIILIVIKLVDKKLKCSLIKVFSALCMFFASFLFMISFIKSCGIILDKSYIKSTIFLGLFAICQGSFIYFVKKVFKRYFYYIDVLEFVGYTGFYITVFIPIVLIILYAIFYSELIDNNPSGSDLFFVLGKAFFSTCVCDLSLIFIIKYFSLKIICKLMLINLGIIYLIFYMVTGKDDMTGDYYFLAGQGLTLIIIILLLQNIYKKNMKREIYEAKKQRIRASL